MTVQELMLELAKHDPSLTVVIEDRDGFKHTLSGVDPGTEGLDDAGNGLPGVRAVVLLW